LAHLKALETILGQFLGRYGGWGLFAISFLDSSFLAFPFINDLLLMKLASLNPHRAVLYSLQCTAGSVLGAYVIYEITRRASRLLSRRPAPQTKSHIRSWIERNDFLSVLVGSLLPPPTPFKIFAIVAGGLQMESVRFFIALLIGRTVRFAFEAWLGVDYGAAAQAFLKKNFGTVCLVTIVVVVVSAEVYRRLRRPPAKPQ
jgi:membrane protein YqaA with SNARE-associated domain